MQITEILIDITAGVTNMHIGWGLLQPELRWDERWERLCSHGHDTTTPDHRPMITDHWDTWDGLWNTWDNDGQMSARHDNNTHSHNILVTDPVTQLWVFCASHHNVWKLIQMFSLLSTFDYKYSTGDLPAAANSFFMSSFTAVLWLSTMILWVSCNSNPYQSFTEQSFSTRLQGVIWPKLKLEFY